MVLLLLFFTYFVQAGDNTLFIGDSHSVMEFGRSLATRLGPDTKRFAVSGSAAADWLKPRLCPAGEACKFPYGYATPDGNFSGPVPPTFLGLGGLARQTDAKIVVVALGTNDADQRCRLPYRVQIQPMVRLLRRIHLHRCFWVGPPTYKNGPVFDVCGSGYDSFVTHMKNWAASHRCTYIDSREILDPATNAPIESDLSDQLHFSDRLGDVWAQAVAAKIRN